MRVRVSPAARTEEPENVNLLLLAYVVGLALGDGNLSNPNGRAVKLRITCDLKYPNLITRIVASLQTLLPTNKVSIIQRPGNCLDVYCHSNKLESWLGWQAKMGSKFTQNARVPTWIMQDITYMKVCLKGLFESDGSVYSDRGYLMAMFVTIIPELATDVDRIITALGFISHTYKIKQKRPHKDRYNIRVSKNTENFIKLVGIKKN